jgi:hypothetical protein
MRSAEGTLHYFSAWITIVWLTGFTAAITVARSSVFGVHAGVLKQLV